MGSSKLKALAALFVLTGLLLAPLLSAPGVKAEDTNWWVKSVSSGRINAVTVAPNGDIIVAGDTDSFGAGGSDVWILRLDANGNVKWQKTYGRGNWDVAYAVAIAPNGDIIVAGVTNSFGAGNSDVWVLRLDANGNVKWQKTYGGSKSDKAFAVAIAPNGNVIVGGTDLLTLDPEGNLKWVKDVSAYDIKILPDGTAVFDRWGDVGRININQVPKYSGWWSWENVSLEVQDTNAQVSDTNAVVKNSNAQIQNTNAEVHDTNVKLETIWTYTSPEGTLKISSTPTSADVYINGTYKGKTPLQLELPPGTYEIKLTKDGYEEYTTRVTLEAGETSELNVKLEPNLENLEIKTPSIVETAFSWGAFPLTIENPTDGEVEIPITVQANGILKVKISDNLNNPFISLPQGKSDSIKLTIPPHQKKTVAIVVGSNGISEEGGSVTVRIGSHTINVPISINSKVGFELDNAHIYLQDLVTQKGYINSNGVKIKVAPIEDLTLMTGYDPRVHGWGFSNSESAEDYNPLSKSGLINTLYAQEGIFGINPPQILLLPLSEALSTYKASQGLCYGMVYTSGLYYEGMLDIQPQLGDVEHPSDIINYNGKTMSAEEVVAAYFASQYLEVWMDLLGGLFGGEYYNKVGEKSQKEAFESFKECLSSGQVCDVSVKLSQGMHEVLAYGLVKLQNGKYVALVYDPNYPKETKIIPLDPQSNDKAEYPGFAGENGDYAKIARILPILPLDPMEVLNKVLPMDKDRILLYLDPVEKYTIKASDGKVLSSSDYLSIKGEDYEVVILPKDEYTIEITGSDYVIVGSIPSEKGVSIYNITAKGGKSQDNLVVGTEKFEYHAGSSKDVSIEVTYAKDNLSRISSVNAKLTLTKNQAFVISNPQQVISGALKVKLDTNGDGVFDKEEIFTKVNSETSTFTDTRTTKMVETITSTSETPTSRSTKTMRNTKSSETTHEDTGICGPAIMLALALAPLIRKKRK